VVIFAKNSQKIQNIAKYFRLFSQPHEGVKTKKDGFRRLLRKLVEAGGFEPPSEDEIPWASPSAARV